MELPVKAMFNLMAQRSPLPVCVFPLSVDDLNGGVGCPHVAGSVNELGIAVHFAGDGFTEDALIDIGGLAVQSVPNDTHTLFGGSAAGEKQQQYCVSHIRSFGLVG